MSVRGFVVASFAAALMLVLPGYALAAPQLQMPNGAVLNDFGQIYLGDSNSRTLDIKSVGSDPVEISSFTIGAGAPGSPDFTITGNTCIGVPLATDATCTVTLKFTPSAVGTRNTPIFVNTTTPAADDAFGVQGIGIDPGIDVTPTSHDFGNVVVGNYGTTKTFEIESTGTSYLSSYPEITGTDAAQFFIANQPDCSFYDPGEICEVAVNVRPLGSAGARSASLVIPNNTKTKNPVTIPLTATATQAHLTTDPASELAFGSVDPFTAQTPNRTMTLTNDGNANLTINDMVLLERNANAFILDKGTCQNGTLLEPEDSCTIGLTFKASSFNPGDYDTDLNLFTSIGNLTRLVSGKVTKGEISASTNSVDVGDVEVGKSGSGVINFTSTGTAPLLFDSGTPTITGPSAAMFDVELPNSCNGLQPGAPFCQAVVTFTPTDIAGKVAYAEFTGNFGTVNVTLNGTGVEAFLNTPVNGINFNETIVGSSTTYDDAFISNGDAAFNLESMTIEGADAAMFSVEPKSDCTGLVRGDECPYSITYTPTTVGSHEAQLIVNGNADTPPIPLTGSARNLTPAKVSLKLSTAKKVWRGGNVTITAKVSKSGEQPTGPLVLKTVLPKKLASAVKSIRIPALGAGDRVVTKTIRIKVKKAAKKAGKLKVQVAVSGSGVKAAAATAIWRMRKRPEIL